MSNRNIEVIDEKLNRAIHYYSEEAVRSLGASFKIRELIGHDKRATPDLAKAAEKLAFWRLAEANKRLRESHVTPRSPKEFALDGLMRYLVWDYHYGDGNSEEAQD